MLIFQLNCAQGISVIMIITFHIIYWIIIGWIKGPPPNKPCAITSQPSTQANENKSHQQQRKFNATDLIKSNLRKKTENDVTKSNIIFNNTEPTFDKEEVKIDYAKDDKKALDVLIQAEEIATNITKHNDIETLNIKFANATKKENEETTNDDQNTNNTKFVNDEEDPDATKENFIESTNATNQSFSKLVDNTNISKTTQVDPANTNQLDNNLQDSSKIETEMTEEMIETIDKLEKIEKAINSVEIDLETFNGSKLEDAYYTIDQDIQAHMISIDNLSSLNNADIKEKRKLLLKKLQQLADIYDDKCENAPPTLTEEERAEKLAVFKVIEEEIEAVDKKMDDPNVDTTEVDNILLDLFTRTNNVDANKDDKVEKEKTKVIKLIQNSMLQLSIISDSRK